MACMREFGNILSAYTCRSCGTEVPNKGAFKKCPVCGIKWD
jgi:rubrerythrin